jgi:hypothetical protein
MIKVKYGKWEFNVIKSTSIYKIGGIYNDCININFNNVISHIQSEPECSSDSNNPINTGSGSGNGTESMIKCAIKYVYNDQNKKNPIFTFDDMSKIDCLPKNMNVEPKYRKIKDPLSLAYLSIVYHSATWYELRFNAEMKDKILYSKYRKDVEKLIDHEFKKSLTFEKFYKSVNLSDKLILEYLEEKYNKSKTLRDFFKLIPKEDKCTSKLRTWLENFIIIYIPNYKSFDWEIDVRKLNLNGGGRYIGKHLENNYRIVHKLRR